MVLANYCSKVSLLQLSHLFGNNSLPKIYLFYQLKWHGKTLTYNLILQILFSYYYFFSYVSYFSYDWFISKYTTVEDTPKITYSVSLKLNAIYYCKSLIKVCSRRKAPIALTFWNKNRGKKNSDTSVCYKLQTRYSIKSIVTFNLQTTINIASRKRNTIQNEGQRYV